jgi:NADPH-dependent 2,4-dienoyl-CoA reductase/sulfur reductase-like enzyme
MTEAVDVVVVGAGPAGMAAAVAASQAGRKVCILDDNPSAGGQIWRGFDLPNAGAYPGARALAHLRHRFQIAHIDTRFGTRTVDRPSPHILRLETDRASSDLAFEHLVVATGARERFLPFPGWTLPGVMGAGGLQAMVKSGLSIAGKRVIVSGSGPLLPAVAAGLTKHGARIVGIFEQASLARLARFACTLAAHPAKVWEGLQYRSVTQSAPYRTNSWIVRAHGTDRLQAVTANIAGRHRELECDYLACGYHLVPNLELPRLLGCSIKHGYVHADVNQQSSVERVYCVGELTGIGGLDKALCEGEIAGLASAAKSAVHLFKRRDRLAQFARQLDKAFALRPELTQLADADTFICRCEDVPRRALEAHRGWREAKLYTRCGMGACQGRICGPATEALFGWKHSTVRPPLTPSRIDTIAVGAGANPES